jgi:predicted transcriptional regulator
LDFGGGKYMYLFAYDAPLTIKSKMIDGGSITEMEFELLFAFTIRQCDLMKLSDFLFYHLQSNFNNVLKDFKPYLTRLTRKYSPIIFSNELTLSIQEWLAENKIPDDVSKSEKVKTNLSVDKLSYLFRVLVDLNLVSPDNKAAVIRMITNNFESKMKENLSQRSVETKFYDPSDESIAFWKDQFVKMIAKTEKDRENNLK